MHRTFRYYGDTFDILAPLPLQREGLANIALNRRTFAIVNRPMNAALTELCNR